MLQQEIEAARRMAAEKAAEMVREGMIVGLGTGRTASIAIERIGELVSGGLRIIGIPSSEETARLARRVGIPLSSLDEYDSVDLTIDGADEVDPQLNVIKGRGGALLREKILAYASREEVIVVDRQKLVRKLGERESLPVEILRFGYRSTVRSLEEIGLNPVIRQTNEGNYITDNGNYIADCKTGYIEKPELLSSKINSIPGVADNGLFIGLVSTLISSDGRKVSVQKRK